MSADLFWFNDEQWSKVEPHLPTNQQGPERHDDRRILSGIMHVQKVGCRWKDSPPQNMVRTRRSTIALRVGASEEFGRTFSRSTATGGCHPPKQVALDSSHVKAHRCASGGKGGRKPRRSGSPKVGETPKIHAVVDEQEAAPGCWSSRPATPRTV